MTPRKIYQGPKKPAIPTVVDFNDRNPDWGAPLVAHNSYLFFLKHIPNGNYAPTQQYGIGAVLKLPFGVNGTSSGGGSDDLQSELLESLQASRDPAEERSLLEFLMQFRNLQPGAIAELESLAGSSKADTKILSLEILCQSAPDSRRYFPRLLDALRATKSEPPASREIQSTLRDAATNEDIHGLEQVSDSPVPAIRRGAMAAIRRLASPSIVPFLVSSLDVRDSEVQYDAIAALAAITGKGGDFGPGSGAFEADPAMHIALWKHWWAQEGKSEYAPGIQK